MAAFSLTNFPSMNCLTQVCLSILKRGPTQASHTILLFTSVSSTAEHSWVRTRTRGSSYGAANVWFGGGGVCLCHLKLEKNIDVVEILTPILS